jgi:hypothetical protein
MLVALCAQEQPPHRNRRLKTATELELEAIIDRAYRRCLRTYTVAGEELLLRIPFGQCGERPGSPGFYQRIFLGGKGRPDTIWSEIDRLLRTDEFARYVRLLRRPGEKTVVFDLERRQFSVFFDPELNNLLRQGPYPGTRTRVYVLKSDSRISTQDVYNFLYCVGSVGLDCSGFIYNVQGQIAAAFGVDLDRTVSAVLDTTPDRLRRIIGLWFFDPDRSFCEEVEDRIDRLRPGDMILFRGRVPGRGIWFRHSAVIQSVDYDLGMIRYLQCTDWATPEQRGVHDSRVLFDPSEEDLSLGDPSLEWLQTIQPTFAGETPLRYWKNDGHRYRSYQQQGGSLVIRLGIIKALIQAREPDFYETLYELGQAAERGGSAGWPSGVARCGGSAEWARGEARFGGSAGPCGVVSGKKQTAAMLR